MFHPFNITEFMAGYQAAGCHIKGFLGTDINIYVVLILPACLLQVF